jgi:hypothetical protein
VSLSLCEGCFSLSHAWRRSLYGLSLRSLYGLSLFVKGVSLSLCEGCFSLSLMHGGRPSMVFRYGLSMRSLYGLSIWFIYGLSLWSLYGPSTVSLWSLYGPSTVFLYGLSMSALCERKGSIGSSLVSRKLTYMRSTQGSSHEERAMRSLRAHREHMGSALMQAHVHEEHARST